MRLEVKLKQLMKERNVTQVQLAEMTGLRQAAISELVNNQRQSIRKEYLEKICEVFGITRIEDILELVEDK
ncbi:helix-turn-helix domain-containing protein [Solibacillus sp. FSL H8-0538]|uniref:helix-turn-helix domain-containing protein n=1 Tax=Solibacillus sp. FSL H8-0538 TaxID=2921400 RepID=UPI0030FCEF07